MDEQKEECNHYFEYATERIEYPPASTTASYTRRIGVAVCVKCGKIVETELN